MKEGNRNRLIWGMTALVVAYAIASLVVYFVSGSFGQGWFIASLVVYGIALAIALVMLVRDRAPRTEPEVQAAPEPADDIPAPVAIEVDTGPKDREPAAG